jgi:uncharacterized UPF0160 family protein
MVPDEQPPRAGTHSGSFHADDVLALALLREFLDPRTVVVRTRDPAVLAECDIVLDVGGEFDPARRRFDHHQHDYRGDRSSAGMVLDWLRAGGHVSAEVERAMRRELVDYVDAVDNGRRTPEADVPCFTTIVGAFTNDPDDGSSMDERYERAVEVGRYYVRGIRAGVERALAARTAIVAAMARAVATGSRVIELPAYLPWKPAYFEHGGSLHPTDFVVFPAEGSWRVVAIPPEPGSFATKVPLPAEWAGLEGDALAEVVGVPGARFCHKNRFLAVFATRESALESLRRWNLV